MMATRTEIGRSIRTTQGRLANENSRLATLRHQRNQVEMLVIEIRGRQAEFIDHIHAARASLVSIAPLQTNVQVAGGYRARMDSEVSGLQNSRALLNIEDMRSRAERHLREIDSQIAQAQQSISGLQRKIYNLNNQYRACEGD